MVSFSFFSRKSIASLTLSTMMLSQFSPFALPATFALTSTFTTFETVANVTAVSEVKASRTLQANATPGNNETITIGSCSVAFVNGAGVGDNTINSDDIDCTGGAFIYNYTLTNPGVQRTPTEIADLLDMLTSVSDGVHGSLAVSTGSATTTTFTTSGTENSGSNITFTDSTGGDVTAVTTVTGVVPVAAVPQTIDFTPTMPTSGETFRATLSGTTYDHTVVGTETVSSVVAALVSLMNADPSTTCVDNDPQITCSADVAGVPFTYAATVVDITAPTISETTPVPVSGSGSTPSYTFASDEAGIITYGGDCSSPTAIAMSGSNTITFNTLSDGLHSNCTITVTDNASNTGNTLTSSAFTIDATSPSVVLTTSGPNPTNDDFTVTATFSESVTGVTLSDFVLTNATGSAFIPLSPTVYTILVSPLGNGPVTIDMPVAAVVDGIGNPSTAAPQLSVTFDGIDPNVVLSASSTGPTNAPFVLTATFSESVTGVTVSDFAITNATKTSFTIVSPTVYTVLLSPSSNGLVTANMAPSAAVDLAGNNSTAATSFSRVYDTVAPVISEITPVATPTNDATPDYTFTTNETGTISYSGACSSTTTGATVGSNTLTFNTLPEGMYGSCMITVTDVATNVSTPLTISSFIIDTTSPGVVLTTSSPDPTNDDFTVTATFSESVTGVTLSDFIVTNATKSALTVLSSTGYTILVSPLGDGPVTTDVGTGVAMDTAGNTNTAASTLSVTYDGTDPSVILSASISGTTNAAFTVTATFSESVIGVTVSDFVVTNGVKTLFTALSATGYTVLVTPVIDGPVTINMPIAAAVDLAGNNSSTPTGLSLSYDATAPTASVVYSNTGNTNQAVLTTLTGASESIVVTNNSGSTLYTFLSNGTFTFDFSDLAGNTGSTLATVANIDTTPPVVTLSGSATLTLVQGALYTEDGASWTDNVDGSGDILSPNSGSVNTALAGVYILSYFYVDTASNTGNIVTRTITITDQTPPVTILSGSVALTVSLGSVYTDAGASWTDNVDGTGNTLTGAYFATGSFTLSGSVNTSLLGTYTLTYDKVDLAGNVATGVTRTVTVTDQTPPVVTLSGSASLTIAHGSVYTDAGASWMDNVDGSGNTLTGIYLATGSFALTGAVNTATIGTYILTYKKVDTAGNISISGTRTVSVTDQVVPVVTLLGASTMSLVQGGVYTDAGASWTDNVDGTGNTLTGVYGSSGSFALSGSVNTSIVGTYILTYKKVDLAGNNSLVVTRTVSVTAPVSTGGGSSGGGNSSGGGGGGSGSPIVLPPATSSGSVSSSGVTSTGADIIILKKPRKIKKFKPYAMYVDIRGMTLYETPSSTGASAGKLKINTQVTVIEVQELWIKVQTDTLVGWALKSQFRLKKIIKSPQPVTITLVLPSVLYTNTSRVNVREKSTANSRLLGYLEQDRKVEVGEEDGEWVKVKTIYFPYAGWVKRSQLRSTK